MILRYDDEILCNDEPQADQDFSPYDKMVRNVKEAMDKAVKETERKGTLI